MGLSNKTFGYWFEKAGGLFFGIVVCCFVWATTPVFSLWKPFIVEFPAIGMCAFGFLLTFLGIILQGTSETIKWMMSRNVLYNRFVAFNKRVVIISFTLSLYSYMIGYFDFRIIMDVFCPQLIRVVKNTIIGVFCGLLVWFVIDTILFIVLFYVLISKKKNDI